ncbi:PAS domain S-box protein [Caenimonas terrae]|uniref:histidine kinase n=1 Tax=Caenimonas terrae TaxID=696074 RepID=A0ABW0N7U4_9BURK
MKRPGFLDPAKPWGSVYARLVCFALLCTLPVFLLMGLDFQRESQRSRAAGLAQVDQLSDTLERRLEQDFVSAETVAQAMGALELDQHGCDAALRRALAVAGPRISNLAIVSPAGQMLCSAVYPARANNLADRPYFQQALQTRQPVLSGFTIGRMSGKAGLQLAVPVLGADGRVTAVAVVGLTAATVVAGLPRQPELPLPLELFDRSGVLVSSSSDSPELQPGQNFAASEIFVRRQALTRAEAELPGLDGVPRVYRARAVHFRGQTVLWAISGADVQALAAGAQAAVWRDVIVVLLLALAVAAVAVLATRPLVLRPHELELRNARRLARLGTWFRDTKSGALEWSEETFELFGRDPALGVPSLDGRAGIMTPDSLALLLSSSRRVLEQGEPFEIEVEAVRPDHRPCWILARGEAVRDRVGRISGVRGTVLDITERKLAAQAVQRSQRQLRLLMDGLGPAMFVGLLTPDGVLVEINRSPLRAVGIEARDVLGKHFAETPWWCVSPQVQQQLRAAIERAAQGEASQYEVRVQGIGEELIDIDFSLQPLRDEAGKVIFLIPSANVITERKRAETALRESESEFRALAESMPQIVWMTRPDGWNIYFNQRWSDYTGLTVAESSGHGWNKPFHPEDQQRAWDAWQLATTTVSTYMLECRLRRADGAYRWWLLRGIAQRGAAGQVLKWVGTCTDIHDIKLAELEVLRANRELRQQKMELQVLFDLTPAAILFKDTENRILRINRRGAQLGGFEVAEVEGRSASEIFPEDAAASLLADQEVIRSGEPQLGFIRQMRSRPGPEVWMQTDRVPYRDDTGQIIGIVIMAQDVSDRKRDQDALRVLNTDLESRVRQRTAELTLARSEAELASGAKSDFLAAMSHEIRTPMSGMLGLLELLELGDLDDGQKSTLTVARDSGTSLMRIIDDILDFSKIEANSLELNLVAGSVASVVTNACRLHAQVISSKKLVLRTDISAHISPLLSFDPLRLGQILNNFLNNAIKFTAAGSIDVSVELMGWRDEMEELRFVVRDTGIGMTPAQVDRLFQPFVQAAAETSAKFGGTGLGLVICRRLAELMGGAVEVESELGVGTSMVLRLPFEVCKATGALRPEHSDHEALRRLVAGRRIAPSVEAAQADGSLLLIVDDHPTNRTVLLRQAAALGYAAEIAEDGAQALAAWRSGRFAAVITDCSMPVMDGYQLARAIRAAESHGTGERVPIVACTANALPSAAEFCFSVGMDACLVKPASLADLSAILARWVPLGGEAGPTERAAAAAPLPPALPKRRGLLDLALLAEISGGDPAAQADMLLDLRQANDADAAALREGFAAQDYAVVVQFAHRIRGSCLMLGATSLGEAGCRIEKAAAAGQAADLGVAMASFDAELQRLNAYLETVSRLPPRLLET